MDVEDISEEKTDFQGQYFGQTYHELINLLQEKDEQLCLAGQYGKRLLDENEKIRNEKEYSLQELQAYTEVSYAHTLFWCRLTGLEIYSLNVVYSNFIYSIYSFQVFKSNSYKKKYSKCKCSRCITLHYLYEKN